MKPPQWSVAASGTERLALRLGLGFGRFVSLVAAAIELSALIWNRSVPPIRVLLFCRSERSTGGSKPSHKCNRNGYADISNHIWFSLNKGGIRLSPIRLEHTTWGFRRQLISVKKWIFFKILTDVHAIVNHGFMKLKRHSSSPHFQCSCTGWARRCRR